MAKNSHLSFGANHKFNCSDSIKRTNSYSSTFYPDSINHANFCNSFGAAVIGPVRSLIAQFAYLLLAAVGLPVLAGNKAGIEAIFGATAGYLFAFLVASYVVGLLAKKITTKRIQGVLVGYLVGSLIIYAMGATWLAFYTGKGFYYALLNGVVPFFDR